MNTKKTFRKSFQKKFNLLKQCIIERPIQGWIKTIREFFGMTTTQLAKKLDISQSRIVRMEQNEKNIKISTMLALNLQTKYYTTKLHIGAFYLPAFLEQMLQEVE